MRAGIVHQDDALRGDHGQKVADFLLAHFDGGIAEQHVNGSGHRDFQARLIARINPLGQAGTGDAVLRFGVNQGIGFAGDDFSRAVAL